MCVRRRAVRWAQAVLPCSETSSMCLSSGELVAAHSSVGGSGAAGSRTAGRFDIVLATGAVSTLAGHIKLHGYAEGTGTSAKFNWPVDIAVTPDGTAAIVVDNHNHRIRRASRLLPA